MIENKICEGTHLLTAALRSGMTSLQVMVACKKCGLEEQCSSDIAVSCAYPGSVKCRMETQFSEAFLIHATNHTLQSHSR